MMFSLLLSHLLCTWCLTQKYVGNRCMKYLFIELIRQFPEFNRFPYFTIHFLAATQSYSVRHLLL